MALGPWPVFVNLLVALIAGTGAVVLLLLAAFGSLIGGWLVTGAVLVSLALSITVTAWLARRQRPPSASTGYWAAWAETGRRVMMAAFAIGAVAVGAAFAANLVALKRPAQAKVAAAFQEHRGDFEALRDMALADRLFSVIEGGDTFARAPFIFRTPGELGIPPERVALFQQRLKAAGCSRIDVSQDGSVRFAMASWGAANHGWRVSLIWSKEKPTPLLPTIDDFGKAQGPRTWESAYSALGDDWYVGIVW